jgi:outer membrane protein assembly factor BamA
MLRTRLAAGLLVCGLLPWGAAVAAPEPTPPAEAVIGVAFEGAEQLSADELKQLTSLAPGMLFDEAKAAADCAAIIRRYQERGYPFVTCSPSLHAWTVWCAPLGTVVYHVHEGPKVEVQRVEFAGNSFVSGIVLANKIESHKLGSLRTNFAAVQDDVERVMEYYRGFGFLDVAATYELQWNLDGGEAVMMFYINEGSRYQLPDTSR